MSNEYLQLLIVKDEISKLNANEQASIRAAAEEIRSIVKRADGIGMMAIALVGSEVAAGQME